MTEATSNGVRTLDEAFAKMLDADAPPQLLQAELQRNRSVSAVARFAVEAETPPTEVGR